MNFANNKDGGPHFRNNDRVSEMQVSGESDTRQISRSIEAPNRRPAWYHTRSAMSDANVAASRMGHSDSLRSTACALATRMIGHAGSGMPPCSMRTERKTAHNP
jgi:hypothetical protein